MINLAILSSDELLFENHNLKRDSVLRIVESIDQILIMKEKEKKNELYQTHTYDLRSRRSMLLFVYL